MLRIRVVIAFFVLLVLTVFSSVVIYLGVDRADHFMHRYQKADDAHAEFIELSVLSEQLLRLIAESAFTHGVTPDQAKAIRSTILKQLQDARQAVISETGLLAKDSVKLGTEASELATLAFLEVNLRRALDVLDQAIKGPLVAEKIWAHGLDLLNGSPHDGFRTKLNRLVTEEIEQVEAAHAAAQKITVTLKWIAVAYCLVCVSLALLFARYFTRRIRAPFATLLGESHAIAQGNLDARISIQSGDEFQQIADNFNAIAADRQEKRAALLTEQRKLEGQVNQRTEELRWAMERLSLADRLRRELFADISHELRTPLTAIRGEAEVALRHKVEGDAYHRAALTRVSEISGQLARLIDDLLFLSRADAKTLRMNMSVIILRKVLESVCAQAITLATEHSPDASIVLENEDPDVTVFADYDRLHQLFIILVDNALCYSGTLVDIRIGYRVHDQSVTIQVSDRGSGMSQAELATAFLRFHRGENARERRSEGLGLGLPIAKAIVDAHDGTIQIESKPGVGTTVSVTLNLARHLRVVA